MTIQHASKTATLPELGFDAAEMHAYEVQGRAYVSMSELARSTRGHRDTRPVQRWVDSVTSNASDAKESQGFPQAERIPFECSVETNSGVQMTHLITPGMAFNFWLAEVTNPKVGIEVSARAVRLIQAVGTAGFETLCQESLGLRASMSENLTAAVRLQADLSVKAQDMQRLKLVMYQAFMPHRKFMTTFDLPKNDLYYPISKQIKKVFNSVYSRLDEGVHSAISTVQKNTPTESYKRATKYSCLTAEAKDALKPVINAYITGFKMLQTPATPLDVDRIIANVDSIYPRYDLN